MSESTQAVNRIEMQLVSARGLLAQLWQKVMDKLPLIRKGGAAIADQALFAGSNFIINVLLARFLIPEQYGAFATAYAIFLLLGSLYIAVIIEPMLVYGAGKYNNHWNRYLGIILFGHWVLSIVLSFVIVAVAFIFQQQGSATLAETMLGLCIAQPFILMNWTLRRAFYVNSQPQWASSGGVVYLVLMLAGTFAAFAWGILSSFTALIVIAIASLMTSIWFMFLLKPTQLRQRGEQLSVLQVFKDHINYGKWSAPTMILTWIPSNIYYTVLPLVVGLAGSGALKASMNLIMPILHANTAISVLLAPTFVRALKYGGKSQLNQRTNFGLLIFSLTCGVYWVMLMLYGNQIINFLYGGSYNEMLNFGTLFIMGLIPLTNGIGEIISGALRALGKLNYILWTHVVSGAFTLTVSLGLLFAFGTSGAYLGLLLASAMAATIAYGLYRHGLKHLKREHIDKLHSFDSTEAAVAASTRAQLIQAANAEVSVPAGSPDLTRLLIIDYDATPLQIGGSWSVIEALAQEKEVWVIMGTERRADFDDYDLSHVDSDKLHLIFFDMPRQYWLRWLSMAVYQYLWQFGVFLLARHLHKQHTFDVIHHLTPSMHWLPRFTTLLPIPNVLGPLQGGAAVPAQFREVLTFGGKLDEWKRATLRAYATIDPLLGLTLRRAKTIYTTDADTAHQLERIGIQVDDQHSAYAFTEAQRADLRAVQPAPAMPFRFVAACDLDGMSGMEPVLTAFADVLTSHPDAELWIYGTGTARSRLQARVQALSIEHRVWFKGTLSAREWRTQLPRFHSFIHMNLRGTDSALLYQALASGHSTIVTVHGANALWASDDNSVMVSPKMDCSLHDRLVQGLHDLLKIEDEQHLCTWSAHAIETPALTTDGRVLRYLAAYDALHEASHQPAHQSQHALAIN